MARRLPLHILANLEAGRVPPAIRRRAHNRQATQQRIQALLRLQLPAYDFLLAGWFQITGHLLALGFAGPQGTRVRPETVRRWIKQDGCPVLRGFNGKKPPRSTTYALTAWALSFHDAGALPRAGQHARSPLRHMVTAS